MINTLIEKYNIKRDEIFISTKNGYLPDDADKGKSVNMLIDELVENNIVSKKYFLFMNIYIFNLNMYIYL